MIIQKKRKIGPGKTEAVVLPIFEKMKIDPLIGDIPEWRETLKKFKLKGIPGRDLVFYSDRRKCWLLAIGAGRADRLNDARKLARKIVLRLKENRIRQADVDLRESGPLRLEYLINLVDYLHLNGYRFDRYLRKKEAPLRRIDLVLAPGSPLAAHHLRERDRIGRNVRMVRDLINDIPANVNPDSLVRAFLDLARENGLKAKAWRKTELERRKMNGLLAVGGSSCCEPALAFLEYAPREFQRTGAVVGKGITFDSGGLNIKTGRSMEEMKCDMSGAALVAGILKTAAILKLPVRVVGLAAIAENMPGRRAYKPGDIITYANRKTVEVVNTDAEGRLVLADALIEAARLKPDFIIEFSTLTGAIVTALGDGFAGLMTRNRKLGDGLTRAGESTGEFLWEMPLFDEYKESIKSFLADLKNADYNGASSAKAGLFLSEFVGRTPFAHIDIAGTAFLSKPNFFFATPGATGFGLRLTIDFLKTLAKNPEK